MSNLKPKEYYGKGNIETIEYIKDVLTNSEHLDAYEGYLLGTILKYESTRLGVKDTILKDLTKSKDYLNWFIDYQKEKENEK